MYFLAPSKISFRPQWTGIVICTFTIFPTNSQSKTNSIILPINQLIQSLQFKRATQSECLPAFEKWSIVPPVTVPLTPSKPKPPTLLPSSTLPQPPPPQIPYPPPVSPKEPPSASHPWNTILEDGPLNTSTPSSVVHPPPPSPMESWSPFPPWHENASPLLFRHKQISYWEKPMWCIWARRGIYIR